MKEYKSNPSCLTRFKLVIFMDSMYTRCVNQCVRDRIVEGSEVQCAVPNGN